MRRLAVAALILGACTAQRIWLIAHSEVIARDGARYIRMARQWADNPRQVIENYDYHVGYPALISALHGCLRSLGGDDSLRSWDLTAQTVSLVGGVLAVAAVGVMTGISLNWRVAWITALLWGLGRKWASLGADALSDAPALACQVWSVVACLLVARALRRRRPMAIALAVLAGVLAGMGYWIRPESLAVVVLGVALFAVLALRKWTTWKLSLASSAAALVSVAAVAAPYAILIGGLSRKKAVTDIVFAPAADSGRGVLAVIAAGNSAPVVHLLSRIGEAMHPVVAALACVGVLTCASRCFRRTRLASVRPMGITFDGAFLGVGLALLMAVVGMGLYVNMGYLSHRHALLIAAMGVPLAGVGVIVTAQSLCAWATRMGRRLSENAVVSVIALVCAAGILSHSLRPLHEGKGYLRQAGMFLRSELPGDVRVLTDSARLFHYADRPGAALQPFQLAEGNFLTHVRGVKPTHLALHDGHAARQALARMATQWSVNELTSFQGGSSRRPDVIRIYAVTGKRLE